MITEADLFEAMVAEIAPRDLEPGEFLQAALVKAARVSRTTVQARMNILIKAKRVSARKDYFMNEDGVRREQWAYKFIHPEKELKTRTRKRVRVKSAQPDMRKLAAILKASPKRPTVVL